MSAPKVHSEGHLTGFGRHLHMVCKVFSITQGAGRGEGIGVFLGKDGVFLGARGAPARCADARCRGGDDRGRQSGVFARSVGRAPRHFCARKFRSTVCKMPPLR
jgi:hypothetical protein